MASPQLENGYMRISGEIVKVMARTDLTKSEAKIVWAVFSKTWLWHKKFDWIALSQFQKMTGLNRPAVCRTKKRLVSRMILVRRGKRIGFNKNYEQWVVSKPILVSKLTRGSINLDNQVVSKLIHTKDTNTKDTNTKEQVCVFDRFWQSYPKKVGKKTALKSWKRDKLDSKVNIMVEFIEKAKETELWQRDGGRSIPHPTTFLNQERWKDDLAAYGKTKSKIKFV